MAGGDFGSRYGAGTLGAADGWFRMIDHTMLAAAAPTRNALDPNAAVDKVSGWLDWIDLNWPNFVAAGITFLLFLLLAYALGQIVRRSLAARQRSDLGAVLGSLVKWALILWGLLIALTIVMPSLNPGDLVAGLGVSSIAIGFAFKDILQNWLAGLLILLRQPFRVGDQIEVDTHVGTVESIKTRATNIRTYDGQRIVIPNSTVYTNSVVVKTAYATRRAEYDVGIGYGDDLDAARDVIRRAVDACEHVDSEHGIDVLTWDLAASWVTIRVRWWTKSLREDLVATRAEVIRAIKYALDEAGIDMPYETHVHLFHDQTEDIDGVRGEQREGWPGGGDVPEPRWRKQIKEEIMKGATE